MQKKLKKLNLLRETLTPLTPGGLMEVEGGGTSGYVTCGPTLRSWCGICQKVIEDV